MASEVDKILDVLRSYEAGVNQGDADDLGALYEDASILFPDRMDTFEGSQAIAGFYRYAFSLLSLNLTFTIEPKDIIVVGDMAYATTHSTGTRLIKQTNETVPEVNRELWVFRKIDEEWKISRYCFNKTE